MVETRVHTALRKKDKNKKRGIRGRMDSALKMSIDGDIGDISCCTTRGEAAAALAELRYARTREVMEMMQVGMKEIVEAMSEMREEILTLQVEEQMEFLPKAKD